MGRFAQRLNADSMTSVTRARMLEAGVRSPCSQCWETNLTTKRYATGITGSRKATFSEPLWTTRHPIELGARPISIPKQEEPPASDATTTRWTMALPSQPEHSEPIEIRLAQNSKLGHCG